MSPKPRVDRAKKSDRPPPPLSMTACWDKAKWHYDGDFPKDLPLAASWAHITATMRFLDERGMLTAEGKRNLACDDEETSFGPEHVKRAAHAFLDECYQEFIERHDYGQPPDVAFLELRWRSYEDRFDLKKRVVPNAFQKLLIRSWDKTLTPLFYRLNHDLGLVDELAAAIPFAPANVQPLIESVIAVFKGDAVSTAMTTQQPDALLKALTFATRESLAVARWRSVAVLSKRFRSVCDDSVNLVHAGQILASGRLPSVAPALDNAIRELSDEERDTLATIANRLFRDHETRSLGKTAMTNVGNAESIHLLDIEPPSDAELMDRYSDGSVGPTPLWKVSRDRAKRAIAARLGISTGEA